MFHNLLTSHVDDSGFCNSFLFFPFLESGIPGFTAENDAIILLLDCPVHLENGIFVVVIEFSARFKLECDVVLIIGRIILNENVFTVPGDGRIWVPAHAFTS